MNVKPESQLVPIGNQPGIKMSRLCIANNFRCFLCGDFRVMIIYSILANILCWFNIGDKP